MDFGIFELLQLIGALGFFIFGMKIMSDGIQKVAGSKMRSILSKMTSNRFLGITTGFILTALLQSSSATTVMIVSFVNAGLLSLVESIGVIMGANIGTSITNTIVSLGHIVHKEEFKRAFSASVVHDFFNILAVTIIFPLEIMFGAVSRSAMWLSSIFLGFFVYDILFLSNIS